MDKWNGLDVIVLMLLLIIIMLPNCTHQGSKDASPLSTVNVLVAYQWVAPQLREKVFAVEVLRVIGLSPCQPDHAFEASTTIKVITMQILWPSSSLWSVTKELRSHFDGE